MTSRLAVIRAAGGVVWRAAGEDVEVCLVHRPRYGDWSLPKGKLEPGEHPLLAAVREVGEETGLLGVPQAHLAPVHYLSRGLPKTVDFWSMRLAGDGVFDAVDEVDEVRWVGLGEAERLLSYPHDVGVLREFAALPRVTVTICLVRHASAGKRGTWSGPDLARPLDERGWEQARALAPLLSVMRPGRLVSSAARRCVQTLGPLAEALDLPIEADANFEEPKPGQDAHENALAAAGRLVELAGAGVPAVVCSQGKVIPPVLARLAGGDRDFTTQKGGGWLLAFAGESMVAADPL